MTSKPTLPTEVELPAQVNGWEHKPDRPQNAHVWADETGETWVGLFAHVGDVVVTVSDGRVTGAGSQEQVACFDRSGLWDTEAISDGLEAAIRWMKSTHPTEWSCSRVSEDIFIAPSGFTLEQANVNNQDTTVYYRREGYDPEEQDLGETEPEEFARQEQPYLYVHTWAGSGNSTVALAPWKHAHGVGTQHPEIHELHEFEGKGLGVALTKARQWASEHVAPDERDTQPKAGQTRLGQFTSVATDGGRDEAGQDGSAHSTSAGDQPETTAPTDSDNEAGPRILTIASCGSQKQSLSDGETVPARELYTSAIHSCKDTYGQHSHAYYIASAKFGLVEHDEELPEYDLRLSELPEAEQREWGQTLVEDLQDAVLEHDADAVVFIGGKEYVGPILQAATEQGFQTPLFTPWQSHDSITGSGKGMAWCNTEEHWPTTLSSLETAVLGPTRLSANS